MTKILLVGAGGAIGAILRFLISGWSQRLLPNSIFPYGTLTVNVIGCIVIGLLAGLAETRQILNPETRAFLMIGILGGLTTFSSFGLETYNLFKDGDLLRSGLNVIIHVIVAFVAVWAGYALASLIGGK